MNVQIADINETRKALTVTLDTTEVDAEHKAVVGEFTRQVRLPGFRPGKAPAQLVTKRFAKEIQDEFRSKVVGRAYREGLEQSKLDVLGLINVEQGAIEPGVSAAIKLTVDVRPDFQLPEYSGLKMEIKPTDPTEAEIDAIIEGMRAERADFKVAERASQKGDYVRFGYEGSLDGQPLGDIVGDKAIYAKAPQTWEEVEGANQGLLPGMAKQLAGVKAGDKKDVDIAFPAEFSAVPALAGKTVRYAIEVQEVRERVLPALDEAFFKASQVEGLDQLKERIKQGLVRQKQTENNAAMRRQISDALLAQAGFPVPESMIASERDGILRQFIEENMRRGVSQEDFEKNKKELFDSASRAAVTRVRLQLILARIAENEKLKVDEKDLNQWLVREAMRTGQKPDKIAKDLGRDRDVLRSVQQQIMFDKALDFLVAKANVTVTNAAQA